MRAATVPAALLVLALAGCTGNAPTAPTAPTAVPVSTSTVQAVEAGPAGHESAQPRPIKGACVASYAEPPVVALPIIRHVSVGTCQLSHLGRVSLRTVAELNVATLIQVAEAISQPPKGISCA